MTDKKKEMIETGTDEDEDDENDKRLAKRKKDSGNKGSSNISNGF